MTSDILPYPNENKEIPEPTDKDLKEIEKENIEKENNEKSEITPENTMTGRY